MRNKFRITPFHTAAQVGTEAIMEMFLKKHREEELKVKPPVVHTAASNGRTGVVKLLLDEYGDHLPGRSSLVEVTAKRTRNSRKRTQIMILLLERGVMSQYGQTAFHAAAQWGKSETLDELARLESANVNVRDNNGWTPMHFAAKYGHTRAVQVLANHAADVKALTGYNQTPMDLARTEARQRAQRNETPIHDDVMTLLNSF